MQPRLALHLELVPTGGLDGDRDPERAFLNACASWLGLERGQQLDWNVPANHTLEGGRILRWAPFRQGNSTLADIVVHAPDPLDKSLQWSTQVTYVASTSTDGAPHRQLNIRVGTDGGTENGAPPPVRPPRLLPELDVSFTLVSNDGPLQRVPTQLEAGTLDAFVRFVLSDPARTMPVLLLTELPEGGYVIPPEQFASEFFGLGLSFMLRHSDTFALSDAVGGHARSVFLGSARAYLPGFTLDADPFQHPLVLARALRLGSGGEGGSMRRGCPGGRAPWRWSRRRGTSWTSAPEGWAEAGLAAQSSEASPAPAGDERLHPHPISRRRQQFKISAAAAAAVSPSTWIMSAAVATGGY